MGKRGDKTPALLEEIKGLTDQWKAAGDDVKRLQAEVEVAEQVSSSKAKSV